MNLLTVNPLTFSFLS